jgi:hypothetical protein
MAAQIVFNEMERTYKKLIFPTPIGLTNSLSKRHSIKVNN